MGEPPVFTCRAHVFTIDQKTKKSWVAASSQAVEVKFFYDRNKDCYRIVSVEDGDNGKKVVINSSITPKMTFKKTSQKFGQWTDGSAKAVYGLGFIAEDELDKFVEQFVKSVEATRKARQEDTDTGRKNSELSSSSFDAGSISPPGGSSSLGWSPGPGSRNAADHHPPESSKSENERLRDGVLAAQNLIKRLETELATCRRDSEQKNRTLAHEVKRLQGLLDAGHAANVGSGVNGTDSQVSRLEAENAALHQRVAELEERVRAQNNLVALHQALGGHIRELAELHRRITSTFKQ